MSTSAISRSSQGYLANGSIAIAPTLPTVRRSNQVTKPTGGFVQSRSACKPSDEVFQAIKLAPQNARGVVRKIEALSPAERNQLVEKLASTKHGNETLLDKFLGARKHKGFESLNDDKERRLLMRALVPGQTPEHLNKIFKRFKEGNFEDKGVVKENRHAFAEVLATTASESQKVGLVNLALVDLKKEKGDSYGGYLAARLIGSLNSAAEVAKIIEKIDRTAAAKLVKSSVATHLYGDADRFGLGIVTLSSNASVYQVLMKAVSLTGNAREKSKFVAASGDVLTQLRTSGADAGKATRKQVLNGMNAVIGSDPSGVIENTLLQSLPPNGVKSMKEYNRALIDCGMGEVIGLNLKSLQLGSAYLINLRKKYPDGIPGNALDKELKNQADYIFKRFNSKEIRNGQSGAQVATTIGTYMATVNAGIDSITSDRNINLVRSGLLFNGAADINKEYMNIWFSTQKLPISVATAIAKPLVSYMLGNAALNAVKEGKDLKAAYSLIAVPHKNGVRSQGEGFNAYGGAFAAVSPGL